jgi:hypothetical protein
MPYGRMIDIKQAGWSPTAKAEAAHKLALRKRPLENLARGNQHQMTRKTHQYCAGGCGYQNIDPGLASFPAYIQEEHGECACGCGTHNPRKCGGRYWANRYSLSLVVKSDATHRIWIGKQRQARLKSMGM